jgi:hypothetical protein
MMPPSFAQPTIVGQMVPGVTMVTLPRPYAADVIAGAEQAGTVSIGQGDLDALDASVGGTVAAYTQAILNCSVMAGPDATAWTALGHTYAQVHKSIVEAETLWTYTWDPIAQGLRFGTLYDQLVSIQQQLPTWQGKIKTACGTAPPLPVPLAPLTPAQQQEDWAGTIKWVAIAAVVVAGVYFLSPIAMTAIAFVPKPREHAHA